MIWSRYSRGIRNWVGVALLVGLPLLFLAAFFFYPLLAILRMSLGMDGQQALTAVWSVIRQPRLGQVLWFTVWQAGVSTLFTLLLGLPLAFVFARYTFPGKRLLRALTTIPFVMPTVVVAAAFSALLGEQGILNGWLQSGLGLDGPPIHLDQTIWLILLAHVFYNVSVVIRTVGTFWANLDPRLAEAGQMLGAPPHRLFWEITLPLLMPSIWAAGLLIFLLCFTSFGVILILGGLRFATLEVEIYRQAINYFNLPVAAILALIQMGLTFGMMVLYTRMQARASLALDLQPEQMTTRQATTQRERILLAVTLAGVVILLLSPLLSLALRSVTLGGQGWTLAYYGELAVNRRQSAFFVPPVQAVANSVLYAGVTVVLSTVLGILSAYAIVRPRSHLGVILDPVLLLPLGVSAVTLGFGYIVSMGSLRTSLFLPPIAHTLIAAPFVVRTLLPALRSLDPRLREAAAVLGASPVRIWWAIDLPILRPAILVGAVFAFTISLGEFGASLLVTRPDRPTMPVVIYQALSRPGLLNYGQALAMSTILMVVSAAGILVIERFRVGGEEF